MVGELIELVIDVLTGLTPWKKMFNTMCGKREYLFVYDLNSRLICVSNGDELSRLITKEYLENENIDLDDTEFESLTLRSNDSRIVDVIEDKLVILDDSIVKYKKVVECAERFVIKGYSGKRPTGVLKKYETVSKK